MDGETFMLLNLVLVKGSILALALWELWKLRYYPRPPEREARAEPAPTPMGGDRKPLPDCLIPRPALPAPQRREDRVKELA